MQIRDFRPDDLPLLKEMTAEAFDGVSIDQAIEQRFGIINGHDWRWRKTAHLDEDVQRDAEGIFVAEDDTGRTIGYVSSWCDRAAGIGHVPNLVVAAGCRGQGVGRKLLQHVLERFRREGLTHARIETLVQNEVGCGLYESIGFQEVARQIHFAMELSS